MDTYHEMKNLDVPTNDDGLIRLQNLDESTNNSPVGCLQCTYCGKNFAVQARLQRHYRTHTADKPFSCDYCSKQFTVKENLNVHRRSHTKERPYVCTFCNRGFEHSGKLHRHMRTHTGERPHKCEICNKTFVQSGQLVIHMRAHRGEKPYTCNYCDKGFTCSKQLKVHIRIHTGEKPYECETCGKTFGYNHVLKMHKLSHLGEKLYKCTLCEEFFSSRKMFDRHLKSHSKDASSHAVTNPRNSTSSVDSKDIESTKPSKYMGSPNGNSTGSFDTSSQSNDSSSQPISLSYSPMFSPLTPPRSPHVSEHLFTLLQDQPPTLSGDSLQFPTVGNVSIDKTSDKGLRLAVFTTVDGERWACPADLVVRMNNMNTSDVGIDQERDSIELELQKRLSGDIKSENEDIFCASVVKVLETCFGPNRLNQLGYPSTPIDEIIMKTLQLLGSHPCWEPSLSSMDRMKVNLRILLELCVPDPDLWVRFGWKGKSIDEIVLEVLDQC